MQRMLRQAWVAAAMVCAACGAAPSGETRDDARAVRATRQALGIGASADDLRTGWYPDQPQLAPVRVSASDFGQLFDVVLDGQIYAQPLVANGALLVVTERNHVYALDPVSGVVLHDRTLETPWNASDIGCGDLAPTVGITGTPVVDTRDNTAYFTTKTYDSGTSGPAAIFMHAVDVPTLAERPGFPVRIQGSASNVRNVTFDATYELQRPGLILLGNTVYAAFAGHCDLGNYRGFVVGVSTAGALTTMWSAEDQYNKGGGIWHSGGAPMSDGPDTFVVATGNGEIPTAPTPGNQPPVTIGQSWVRLRVQGDGSLKPTDFFAPYDAQHLNDWDADFGSSGPMGLPDGFGTSAHPHLAVASGKQGYVYLLDRDDLGGLGQGPGGGDRVVQRIGPYGGVWSKPAAWPGSGGWVYLPTASGGNTPGGSTGDFNVFRSGRDGSGNPTLALAGKAADSFGLGSSPPVVTSDGTTDGSALVWIVWLPYSDGVGAQLRAYDAVPENGVLPLRFRAPIGKGTKYNPPGVANGRVYVGNRDGHVLAFGAPANQPLTAPGVQFGTTDVGTSVQGTATYTATAAVTVTSLSTTGTEFAVGTTTPPLPASLAAGQTLAVPVTFTPSRAGTRSAALVAQTDQGAVSTSLTGTGRQPTAQLQANPGKALSFGGAALGQTVNGTITFSNIGGAPLTITGLALPSAPFSAAGVPPEGTTVGPGQSVTVTLAFAPSAVGAFDDRIQMVTDAGEAEIKLSGTAAQPGDLQITPAALDFGTVPVGQSVTKEFVVQNVGGLRVTVTKSKPPATAAGFSAVVDLPEGTTLEPGQAKTLSIKFAPTAVGAKTDQWVLNSDGAHGLVQVPLTGAGAGGGSDAGPGRLPQVSSGCSAAPSAASLWPVLTLVPALLSRRRRRR